MYKFVRPFLFLLDSETAHSLFVKLGSFLSRSPLAGLVKNIYWYEHRSLETSVLGLNFKNPIGLAAGFDKDGELSEALPLLGLGFTEIGTVTPLPQPGNPKPRLFRIVADNALINRMGFNNKGADAMAARLSSQKNIIPVGINIGKNKVTPIEQAASDYEKAFATLADSASFVVVNVSSPNTPNLRTLQDRKPLTEILNRLQALNAKRTSPKPILLKIAPDLNDDQLDEIISIVRETKIAGIVATNTTIDHDGPEGGLSGQPLKERTLRVVSYIFSKTGGSITLVGSGGIASAKDAYALISAGASLVEIYTGLIYEGPALVKNIKQGLVELLARDGFVNVKEAVGRNQ